MRQPLFPSLFALSILAAVSALPQPYPPLVQLDPASSLDALTSANAPQDERQAWQHSLVRRQLAPVAVGNAAALPVNAAQQAAAAAAASSAAALSAAQAAAQAAAIAAAQTPDAVAAPAARTTVPAAVNGKATAALAKAGAATPLPAAVSPTPAIADQQELISAIDSGALGPAASSSAASEADAATTKRESSASSAPVSSSSSPATAASAHSPNSSSSPSSSAVANSQKSSSGSIFSPSNRLFVIGILVIIGIIVLAILLALFVIKRAAHLPRYADERDYPHGFPREFLDDKALSKRWSRASTGSLDGHAGLLEDAQLPAGSRAHEAAAREFGLRRAPGVHLTGSSAPVPPLLSLSGAAAPPPPPPPPPPKPTLAPLPSLRPAHAAPIPAPIAPQSPAKRAAPPAPPSRALAVAAPNKLTRARPTDMGDAARLGAQLSRHRYSPPRGRESALRNEL